jgi:hypothetical protein
MKKLDSKAKKISYGGCPLTYKGLEGRPCGDAINEMLLAGTTYSNDK